MPILQRNMPQVNDLSFHFKKLEKDEQILWKQKKENNKDEQKSVK